MTDPWFDPIMYAWIPGTLLGVIGGGIGGPLVGICAARGKCKGVVMAFHYSLLTVCFLLLCLGVFAWIKGQPYGVWYGLALPGVTGLTVFGCLTPVIRKRYQEAELRKTMADDL